MENATPQIKFQWWWVAVGAIVVLLLFVVSGYNALVTSRAELQKVRGDLQSVYQRRADLVPNLVSTVKGAVQAEESILTGVTEARSRATSININAADVTPEQMQKFYDAQTQLGGSLSRLLAVAESYPQLRSIQGFTDLQSQLEGTENRIAVARRDYNNAVKDYNVRVQTFPGALTAAMFGFKAEPYFEASPGSQSAPTVDFSSSSQSR